MYDEVMIVYDEIMIVYDEMMIQIHSKPLVPFEHSCCFWSVLWFSLITHPVFRWPCLAPLERHTRTPAHLSFSFPFSLLLCCCHFPLSPQPATRPKSCSGCIHYGLLAHGSHIHVVTTSCRFRNAICATLPLMG